MSAALVQMDPTSDGCSRQGVGTAKEHAALVIDGGALGGGLLGGALLGGALLRVTGVTIPICGHRDFGVLRC